MFLLGRVGQWVSVLFSALSLLGASAVYWVLMSNFLYHTVKYVYGKELQFYTI
jgi:sodium-coupled neutral amino acid transporter 9